MRTTGPTVAPVPGLDGEQIRKRLADARLYLCTDARAATGDLASFVDAALAGGVDIVQLRDKGHGGRLELAALEVLAEACARHGALLAVNDRADIAVAAGADVLHLGQDDLPVSLARRIAGDDIAIGRSTHDDAQADAAAVEPGVDYFCTGPCWPTPTKPGRPAPGLDLVRHVASQGLASQLGSERLELERLELERSGSQWPGSQRLELERLELERSGSQRLETQQPGSQWPASQQPLSQRLESQQPGSQQPGSQQPGPHQPPSQPASQRPASQQPESQQPGSQQPASQQPASQQPGSQQPGSQQPASQRPASQRLVSPGPASQRLVSPRPGSERLAAQRPWFAIGGIDLTRLDDVLAAGARRIVVVRAITDAEDPRAAAEALKSRLLT